MGSHWVALWLTAPHGLGSHAAMDAPSAHVWRVDQALSHHTAEGKTGCCASCSLQPLTSVRYYLCDCGSSRLHSNPALRHGSTEILITPADYSVMCSVRHLTQCASLVALQDAVRPTILYMTVPCWGACCACHFQALNIRSLQSFQSNVNRKPAGDPAASSNCKNNCQPCYVQVARSALFRPRAPMVQTALGPDSKRPAKSSKLKRNATTSQRGANQPSIDVKMCGSAKLSIRSINCPQMGQSENVCG